MYAPVALAYVHMVAAGRRAVRKTHTADELAALGSEELDLKACLYDVVGTPAVVMKKKETGHICQQVAPQLLLNAAQQQFPNFHLPLGVSKYHNTRIFQQAMQTPTWNVRSYVKSS